MVEGVRMETHCSTVHGFYGGGGYRTVTLRNQSEGREHLAPWTPTTLPESRIGSIRYNRSGSDDRRRCMDIRWVRCDDVLHGSSHCLHRALRTRALSRWVRTAVDLGSGWSLDLSLLGRRRPRAKHPKETLHSGLLLLRGCDGRCNRGRKRVVSRH